MNFDTTFFNNIHVNQLIITLHPYSSYYFNVFRRLDKIFQEVHYWERVGFDIPHYIRMVASRSDNLRSLKEHVLLVVRDYNRLVILLFKGIDDHVMQLVFFIYCQCIIMENYRFLWFLCIYESLNEVVWKNIHVPNYQIVHPKCLILASVKVWRQKYI